MGTFSGSKRCTIMAIPKPTVRELEEIAARIGYRVAPGALADYLGLVSGMLDGYDAIDGLPDERPPVRYPRGAAWRPVAAENPHNAWYVRTAIKGASTGPLAGKRIAIKDSIMIAGAPMMNGAALLEAYVPDVDATVVTRVLDAGAEIAGKTHCEYFCLSGGSHTGSQGPVHNPHKHGYSAGGSSSGSAVVVATGEVDMALGADQAGSIRMPASFSGIVGMKPTYGLVPYTGIAPIEPYFDHVGPMTATVADNARLLEVIAGPDEYDPRQRQVRTGSYTRDLEAGVEGLRIAVVKEGFGLPNSEAAVDAKVRAAAARLATLGARVADISIPMHLLGPAIWTPIGIDGLTHTLLHGQGYGCGRDDHYVTGLMDWLHARADRRDEFPHNVKVFTLLGSYIIERYGYSYYGKAVNRVRRLRAAYDEALAQYDLLLMPTTPMKAQALPPPDAPPALWCQRAMEMIANTCPFDVTHHPALSLPCGAVDALPVGLMLIGRHFDEATIYRAGHAFEQAGDS